MKLEWSNAYSVGDEQLDGHHKRWFELYNLLEELLSSESGEKLNEKKGELLLEMNEYVDYHFKYEEEYMHSIGFPETEKHWRLHKDFRTRIYSIYRDHTEGTIVFTSEILDVLKSWIHQHIIEQDSRITEFLRSKRQV